MKILTPQQIREVDQYTINNEPIPSIDLMERAAKSVFDWILANQMTKSFYIFCGIGNNGGDGLTLARMLCTLPLDIKVFLLKISDNLSPDAENNKNRLLQTNKDCLHEIDSVLQIDFASFDSEAVVIDAIFGSGLNRETEGVAKDVIDEINLLSNTIVSIDIPSGLFASYDENYKPRKGIVKANFTLTFQLPKLSFFLPENAKYVGTWKLLDIGLLEEAINLYNTNHFLIESKQVKKIRKKRTKFSHKGNFGHALLVAGSYGKMGAAVLASKSCLKSGVGLLTTHVPHWGYQIMQTSVPEAMVSIDRSEMFFTEFPELSVFNAIGIGPGINTKKNSVSAFEEILNNMTDQKMVVDADGLNILSQNKFLLVKLPKNAILTPHPKEFERLAGKWKNEMHRLKILQKFSQQYEVITVLKGAHTVISLPDGNFFFNATGNPGMASAGSGDTLTGIILALLAQGYSEEDAAILGVYIHGLAGDVALTSSNSEESLIATDIINSLGNAFNKL